MKTNLIELSNYQMFVESGKMIVISDGNPSSLDEKFVIIKTKEDLKQVIAGLLELSFKVEAWKQ